MVEIDRFYGKDDISYVMEENDALFLFCILHRASSMAQQVKNSPANVGDARDMGSFPRSERSPGGENGNPFQYFCLENSMDRTAWWATVHGVKRVRHDLVTCTSTPGKLQDRCC